MEAIAGGFGEENKKEVTDALKDLVPIDNDRVCVIKGKLTHYKVKRRMVQPHFDREEFPNVHAAEGEGVLALKSHETGAQKSKIPLEKWCPPYAQEDWAALRHCLCEAITTPDCNVMYALLGGFATRIGLKQAGGLVKYLYRAADCRMEHEKFLSGNEEDKATVPREVYAQATRMQAWTVNSAQPQLLCFEKQREHRPSSAHGNVVFFGELFE